MVRKVSSYLLLLTFCFCVNLYGGSAAASIEPVDQLKPFIARIIEILADQKVPHQQGGKVDRIMEVAKEGFDFKEMSKRVLGKKWRTISATEKEEFVELFTQLLKYAYVAKMNEYSSQEIKFGKQRIRGKRAQVNTLLVDGARNISVSYIMLLRGEQWMVYDIVVEGVSLVRNYLKQFQEILHKDDFDGLTRQMETKIAALRQNYNAS